jgi:hypothetical protein
MMLSGSLSLSMSVYIALGVSGAASSMAMTFCRLVSRYSSVSNSVLLCLSCCTNSGFDPPLYSAPSFVSVKKALAF